MRRESHVRAVAIGLGEATRQLGRQTIRRSLRRIRRAARLRLARAKRTILFGRELAGAMASFHT